MKNIKFELANSNAWMQDGNGVFDIYVRPTEENNLEQIPKGVNPRDIDENSTRLKNIKASFAKNDYTFLAKNGGMQILIDDGSFNVNNGFVSFTCQDEDTGHYDGQHTQYAVDDSVKNMTGQKVKNFVKLTLIEKGLQPDKFAIRESAQSINDRTPQKISSELHIKGCFDSLKKNIIYTDTKNIGWKQNQKNIHGMKITAENEVQQAIRLLSTFFPLTFMTGVSLANICKLAKGGEYAVMQLFQSEEYSSCVQPAFKHINYVLEISDFIQKSLKEVLGENHKHFDMIKQCSKTQLTKPVGERKYFKNTLFTGEKEDEGALDKDFILMFIHAIIDNCFEYDIDKQEYVCYHNIIEAKAIWLEYGNELLTIANNKFKSNFTTVFKSRKSDFVNQDGLWMELCRTLNKRMRSVTWKIRLEETSLKQVA